MDWGSVASAIASVCCIATILYYLWDNTRYRRERKASEGEFVGHVTEKLDNIEKILDGQQELCFKERKGLWDRVDENSGDIAFIKGRLNGSTKG